MMDALFNGVLRCRKLLYTMGLLHARRNLHAVLLPELTLHITLDFDGHFLCVAATDEVGDYFPALWFHFLDCGAEN